jgi:hypothetical protein
MKFTASEIKDIIEGVYSGTYTSRKLPKGYYEKFRQEFEDKITEGYTADNEKFFDGLVGNTDEFAAAKTYQMVREMEVAVMALGAKEAFEEAALTIFDRFTGAWGSAESNTVLQSALQAQKWQEIIMDSDLFPFLKYSTIGDACAICRPLDGIVARYDDPIWKSIYPTNHYNCLCLCIQLPKGTQPTKRSYLNSLVEESESNMSPVFLDNVGISGVIFNKKHPYFETPRQDRRFAKRGYGLL